VTQPEGPGDDFSRSAQPIFARDGSLFWLWHNTIWQFEFEPTPPPPRVAAFSGGHVFGNAWQLTQRLRQLDAEERPKLDEEGNPIIVETPSPEERKAALRQLVRAKFEDAANDELMQSYADRPDNNEEVQAKVDAWKAEKEERRAEREAARAEWMSNRAQKEWSM
jgi:hypothetical protein